MKKNETITRYSQQLRTNATKEENTLWYQYLRRNPIQFRRQCAFGTYIVDFYCAKALLAIELDGSQHYELGGIAADAERTLYLNSLGIQVLRFSNADVNNHLEGVCQAIDLAVKNRLAEPVNAGGRKAYSTLQTSGVFAPHPPPFGGTFPQGGRFSERRNYVKL